MKNALNELGLCIAMLLWCAILGSPFAILLLASHGFFK
jgi:hypothetical protein